MLKNTQLEATNWFLVSHQQVLYENRQPIFCLKYTFCMKLNCHLLMIKGFKDLLS